ncbi:hypothetical protein N665_0932s0030 [Sinapis alba]|nr:hypothetical protein N665_0932s0030 [Sinapis alba]
MKTSDAMRMITFLLVVAMITAASDDVVSGEKEVVLDYKGNPVKANAAYFIGHRGPDIIASIARYTYKNRELRHKLRHIKFYEEPVLFSGEESPEYEAVKFSLSDDWESRKVVRVSTELQIRYNSPSPIFSEVWRVNNISSPVKTVVVSEFPIFWKDYGTTFTIQKLKGGYGFAFGSADKPVTICAEVIGQTPIAELRLSNSPLQPPNNDDMSCFPPVNFFPV